MCRILADSIPHRTEGEAVLLGEVPKTVHRILDIGTGDGRLLGLLKCDRPNVECVAIDFSATMLAKVRTRFADDRTVTVIEHNLDDSLPDLGKFDAVVSSFAIHHVEDDRKRSLYTEIFELLEPGGIFCNLEHVASATEALHQKFREALGISDSPDDPSNKLLDVETQLRWLREIGFDDADCYWKWLELALLVGVKPV
ncbi:MAG: class I SAM-dependent methyltransferase [Microcoleus anatoxicus]|uniref:class I SAM-dependent methyltransferase n=1 Tax=Microcoleus anatoxicus TaxID=2705319 RepID=UPI00366DE2F6